MVLATIARSVAQVGLLCLLVLMPLMFLSGAWTPLESMPHGIRWTAYVLPLHYYARTCYAVIFRGAGFGVVVSDLALLAAMCVVSVLIGALRFRSQFGNPSG